jgi:hypothetical protein
MTDQGWPGWFSQPKGAGARDGTGPPSTPVQPGDHGVTQEAANSPGGNGTAAAGTIALPSISLPKGGGAIKGIDEKLTVAPSGTARLAVPAFSSAARQGFSSRLELGYDSGSGNGPFGLGWTLPVASITRKTSKGLPRYADGEDSDVFILSGAEDLTPLLVRTGDRSWVPDPVSPVSTGAGTFSVRRYRPRAEAGFARIERWQDTVTGVVHWRTVTKDNVTSLYGRDPSSRIADPGDPSRVFTWLLDFSYDDRGKGHGSAVSFAPPTADWYERHNQAGWTPFQLMTATVSVDWSRPNLCFADLGGDGLADVLIGEDVVFTWYPWLAEEGFGPPGTIRRPSDEEQGPALVLADSTWSISLADMSGDGLAYLVRIRNGEMYYRPDLGYRRFGAKVTMDDALVFDGLLLLQKWGESFDVTG